MNQRFNSHEKESSAPPMMRMSDMPNFAPVNDPHAMNPNLGGQISNSGDSQAFYVQHLQFKVMQLESQVRNLTAIVQRHEVLFQQMGKSSPSQMNINPNVSMGRGTNFPVVNFPVGNFQPIPSGGGASISGASVPKAGKFYIIRSLNTNKNIVLDVKGSSKDENASIVSWDCTKKSNQIFEIREPPGHVSKGCFALVNPSSGMAIAADKSENSSLKQKRYFTHRPTQLWKFHAQGKSKVYAIQNRESRLYMNVQRRGEDVVQRKKSGNSDQLFVFMLKK